MVNEKLIRKIDRTHFQHGFSIFNPNFSAIFDDFSKWGAPDSRDQALQPRNGDSGLGVEQEFFT